MRQLRTISLFAAFLIVMLHSIVPHVHHEDLSYTDDIEEHQGANNLVDYLALAFHLDHDQGDLEQFTSEDEVAATPDLAMNVDITTVSELKLPVSELLAEVIRVPSFRTSEVYLDLNTLRGPPTIS